MWPPGDVPFEFRCRTLGDNPSLIEDGDVVGKLISFLEVLGREEDGDTALDQLPDDLPHGASTPGVEAGGGLVQEDDLRSSDLHDR